MFNRHKHEWRLVRVVTGYDLDFYDRWNKCTWLYFACNCTETKIEKRWGHWTMEDFNG